MNPFEAIGDFFGGLFGQKKKKDQPQAAPKPVVIQRPQPQVVVNSPLSQPQQQGQAATVVDPTRPAAPKPAPVVSGGVVAPTPLDGLDDADRATAQKITAMGKDPSAFITAAKNANAAKAQASYDNSFIGKVGNFGQEIGKQLNAANQAVGTAYGTALASVSPEVRNAERMAQQERDTEAQITNAMAARLRAPTIDPAQKARIQNFLIDQAGVKAQPTEMDMLHQDMLRNTDPAGVIFNSAGVALTPFVGGLTGAGAKGAVGTGVNAAIDPLTLLSKIPAESTVGKVLNTEVNPGRVLSGVRDFASSLRPNSGVTSSAQPTVKAPAITSPNRRPFLEQEQPSNFLPDDGTPSFMRRITPEPLPAPEAPIGIDIPAFQHKQNLAKIVKQGEQELNDFVNANQDATPAQIQAARDSITQQVLDATGKLNAERAASLDGEGALVNQMPIEPAKPVAAKPVIENPVSGQPAPEIAAQSVTPEANPLPTGDLGTIARKAVTEGRLKSDADSEALGKQVADAINAEAEKTGMKWEDINKAVQTAWEKKLSSYKEAGLTKEQYDVALKAADELSLLRQRADPALISKGQVSKFYSPRATEDTPFTQELVNEISRDRTNGLKTSELDLSTTPYQHAIHRYANASDATASQLFDSVERKVVKDATGNEQVVDTGIKVSDAAKEKAKPALDRFVEAQDKAIKAAESGNAKAIQKATKEADDHINEAIKHIADDLPDTAEGRAARDALLGKRGGYEQSTIRTNMFLNIANRAFDQVQKGIVNAGDIALPIANRVAAKLIGGNDPKLATGFTANRLASKYAKGSLASELNRNFKTNVSLAGAGAKNPLTKGVAKLDSAYRSAGTYLTSLGDTTTNAVRATNMAILGQARAEGITGKAELEKYLVSKMASPEYQSLYHDMNNVYAGYIGMPETITGLSNGSSKTSKFLSQVDNFVKNRLENTPLPARAKQELNDFIQPALTGFAGATNRIFQKSMNAMLAGIPQIRAGLKIAASGDPHAAAVGQMMIARSLIDTVSAGGVAAGGFLLGSQGHWTGGYPSDPNERARWEKDGIQADSFEFDVGGKKVYIQPGRVMGALALPLVMPAVVANAMKEGTDPQKAVGEVFDGTLGQFMNNMGTDAVVQHIADLARLTGSDQDKARAQKDLMNMLGFSISNAVPASGLLNNVANATDPYKRDTSGGIVDIVESRNPFTRGNVDMKTDVLGNPIKNNTQVSLGSSAVTTGTNYNDAKAQEADPLGAEIDRLAKAGSEVMPKKGAKNAANEGNQPLAKLFMNSDTYKSADDKGKADMLNKVLAGTALKDVNSSLKDEQKVALAEYNMAGDKKNVWMENNDNAVNYYEALIANKRANGTLTRKEMDLGQGKDSLVYKYKVALVNKEIGADQDLILGYYDTTKTEFNKMEDGELKQKLLAYDQALEAAGLPSKFKNSKGGYGSTAGGGRGGRGGRGGATGSGANFAFLSMPESLVGAGDTSKSKYESSAPLFKPVADLQAPATVAIPKGRSVSLKRGVTL